MIDPRKPKYEEPKGQAENFNFGKTIYVSRIIIVPKDADIYPKTHWEYTFKETNSYGITHIITYYSKNLLALQEHRNRLVANFRSQYERLYGSSNYMGVEVKPSIIQQIYAKQGQKIR